MESDQDEHFTQDKKKKREGKDNCAHWKNEKAEVKVKKYGFCSG